MSTSAGGTLHVQLHQIDQRGAACHELRAARSDTRHRVVYRGRLCVLKGFHRDSLLTLTPLSAASHRAHGSHNIFVCSAAADISAHAFANGVVICFARLFQQRYGRHNLPRRAIAALKAVVLEKSGLHRMKLAIFREPFDGGDFILLMHHRKGEAGIDAPPVHVHGAGATLAVIAPLLRAKEAEIFAQRVEQRHARFDLQLVDVTVDFQFDRNCARRF